MSASILISDPAWMSKVMMLNLHNYSIVAVMFETHQYRWMVICSNSLTHWSRDKMAAVSQTMFSNAFSWMEMYEFRLKFHWSLFLRFQLTIFQHWFRYWLGAVQATSHYLNQWWLVYWHIYVSLNLNELRWGVKFGSQMCQKNHMRCLQTFLWSVKGYLDDWTLCSQSSLSLLLTPLSVRPSVRYFCAQISYIKIL